MTNIIIRLLLLAVFVPSLVSAADQDGQWRIYVNDRFGFLLMYPASLEAGRPPHNGAGQEFHSTDGKFSLAAEAHFLKTDLDSLETRWRADLDAYGKSVNYKNKGDSWYVVSGVLSNGFEFYRKFFVQGGNWVSFEITYPHSERKKYSPWVEQIAERFEPFLPGDNYDRDP
jgi:hypothetical protein